MASELEEWEAMQAAVRHGSAEGESVEDGEWLYSNFQSLVHNEPVDSGVSNRKVRKWLRFSARSRTHLERHLFRISMEEWE